MIEEAYNGFFFPAGQGFFFFQHTLASTVFTGAAGDSGSGLSGVAVGGAWVLDKGKVGDSGRVSAGAPVGVAGRGGARRVLG